MEGSDSSLIDHLEALRRVLIRILAATVLLCPFAYAAAPYAIGWLVGFCLPDSSELHYFAPMEVFLLQLKFAFVAALVAAYPWNIAQVWGFLVPALYPHERRALGWWIVGMSVLFFAGAAFSVAGVLPLLMRFAMGFETAMVRPTIGVASFLELAGGMALAFGFVFQTPLAVMLAVRFHVVKAATLAKGRPYVIVAILVIAALLTPPDIISQLMLGIPAWLLFEAGLFLARHVERKPR